MKVKTSITLSKDLLKDVDHFAQEYKNRSEFIETALRKFVAELIRQKQDARDLKIINEHAEALNEEAEDVLSYQSIP